MNRKKLLITSIFLLLSFVLWTVLICFVDVSSIGPNESKVGFATLNIFIHQLTGTNMLLYVITDWLGLVPIFTALCFAILGLVQLIKRKSILKVDRSIIVLGVYYLVVIALYIFFEYFVINYRPVLINGYLEASYPSSTTMLVLTVMPTSIMQLNSRIRNKKIKAIITAIIISFIILMVVGRLISGVHWFSDIFGGMLLSLGLVIMYYCIAKFKNSL